MKKRIESTLLALAILLSLCSPLGGLIPQAQAAETEEPPTAGTWGDNLRWELSGTTLMITGTGDMKEGEEHYNDDPYDTWEQLYFPWYHLTFDSVVIGEGVTSIAPGAFADYNLRMWETPESITLPSTLKTIGNSAFYGFCGEVTIPSGVTRIGAYAFYGFPAVTLSEGLESIGDCAFWGCRLSSIELPSTLTHLGDFAFAASTSTSTIQNITVAEGSATFCSVDGVLFNKDQTELVLYPQGRTENTYMIPDTVTKIRTGAFYGCKALTDIGLPDDLRELGDGAFAYSGLVSIWLSRTLTTIGDGVFAGCQDLDAIYVLSGNTHFRAVDGVLFDWFPMDEPEPVALSTDEPEATAGPTELIAYPSGKQNETYEIPESVTAIRPAAFCENAYIKELTVPDTVNRIDAYTFYECTSLTTITLPSQLDDLGDYVFSNCPNLQSVTLPSGITSIGDCAFSGCSSLPQIVIPEGVQVIGTSAFERCRALCRAAIPNTVTVIKSYAFSDCSNLTEFTIPNKIEAIGSQAFQGTGCTGENTAALDLVIPSTIQYMGDQIFYWSHGLRSITLPSTLEGIPSGFAWECSNLQEVMIPEGVSIIAPMAFDHCTSLRELSLPKSISVIDDGAFQSSGLEKVYYAGTRAEWGQITIYEHGNTELTTALIHCTDGYYGVEDPDRPQYATINRVETSLFKESPVPPFRKEFYFPLACGTTVTLFLDYSWFEQNSALLDTYKFLGKIRISSGGKELSKTKDGQVTFNTAANGETESSLTFFLSSSDLSEPFQPNQPVDIEILDTNETILAKGTGRSFPIQSWLFGNYDATISKTLIKSVLGKTKGKEIIKKVKPPIGESGMCFGEALTASLVNFGEISPTLFENCTILDQVQLDTAMTGISPVWWKEMTGSYGNKTANGLIQISHVMQHKPSVQKTLERTAGDFEQLIEWIDLYKAGKSAMPLIYMKAKNIHTICAYDYEIFESDDSPTMLYIFCYDANFPQRIGEISVMDYMSRDEAAWSYTGIDGYAGLGDSIAFLDPAYSYSDDGTYALLSMDLDWSNSIGMSGPILYTKLKWISNASDTESTGTDTTDADTGLYWISGSGEVSVADLAGEAVSIADDYAIYTINSASTGSFALTDGGVDTMTAVGDTVSLSCEYYLEDETGQSTLVRVTFDGASAGTDGVSLGYDPSTDTVTLTGAGAGTITVVYDDEDDTTTDPSWTETVTGNEPTVSVTVTDGCQYDAASHTVTLNTIPLGTENVLIAAYADGQMLSITPGTLGRTALNAAAHRADEIRIFYLDADQCPAAESSRIQIPQN